MIKRIGIIGSTSNLFMRYRALGKNQHLMKLVKFGRKEYDFFLDLSANYTNSKSSHDLSSQGAIDVVVIFAGITKPDRCAADLWYSSRVNVVNLIQLISHCLCLGKKVVFISSDTVFDGSRKIVSEIHELNPESVYGTQKAIVETYFRENHNFKCVRLSYVLFRNDFILDLPRYSKGFALFEDFCRNVVVEDDVYDVLDKYLLNFDECPSVVNVCGFECLSKLEIGMEVANAFDLPSPRASSAPKEFFINRSKKVNMKSLFIEDVLNRSPQYLSEWLKQIEVSR